MRSNENKPTWDPNWLARKLCVKKAVVDKLDVKENLPLQPRRDLQQKGAKFGRDIEDHIIAIFVG